MSDQMALIDAFRRACSQQDKTTSGNSTGGANITAPVDRTSSGADSQYNSQSAGCGGFLIVVEKDNQEAPVTLQELLIDLLIAEGTQ